MKIVQYCKQFTYKSTFDSEHVRFCLLLCVFVKMVKIWHQIFKIHRTCRKKNLKKSYLFIFFASITVLNQSELRIKIRILKTMKKKSSKLIFCKSKMTWLENSMLLTLIRQFLFSIEFCLKRLESFLSIVSKNTSVSVHDGERQFFNT